MNGFLSGNKVDASSYMASRKKFSRCEINFVKLLDGQLPAEIMGTNRSSLWSKEFSSRNYLDELKDSPVFQSSAERTKLLEDLGKFAHKDETYLKNLSEVATLMKNEGLVSVDDLRRIFVQKDFPFAKFIYSHTQKKLLASLDIDPAKSSLIESLIGESSLEKYFADEYRQILRASSLGADELELGIKSGLSLRQDKTSLETFRHYVEFLDGQSAKKLGASKVRSGMENIERIYDKYDPKWYDVDKWFKPHKKFLANTPENINREAAIKAAVNSANLSNPMKGEYRAVLRKSGLNQKQIEFAHQNGMTLRSDKRSFDRFKEYMVYLDYLPQYKVKNGLRNIEKIYQYGDDARFYIPAGMLPPHKQFIAQRQKIIKHEKKRLQVIQRDFKMQEKEKLMKELDEIIAAKARGEKIDETRIPQIRSEIDSVSLSPAQLKRVQAQARGEAGIFRKLLNGCNGGGSARLASATRKFKNFKLALAIGGTPLFYLKNNWDKKDEDQYFWEKLGQEMAMGLFFTVVANKIITNTDKGFWSRYLESYVKFGAMDVVSSGSYDMLFGQKSYGRYFQKIYNGGELTPTEAEIELEKLKNSPTFEKDVEELLAYLEEHSEKKNFKNLLDKHFNLSTYSSLDDEFSITQEDLETEEAREIMLELLAEKMYLASMGDWPIFQTGNKGADRWAFYRGRNVLMDMKGMALNIAMFEIMCREPLGKVGSWGLVLALTVGDWMVTGDLSSSLRREAINQ